MNNHLKIKVMNWDFFSLSFSSLCCYYYFCALDFCWGVWCCLVQFWFSFLFRCFSRANELAFDWESFVRAAHRKKNWIANRSKWNKRNQILWTRRRQWQLKYARKMRQFIRIGRQIDIFVEKNHTVKNALYSIAPCAISRCCGWVFRDFHPLSHTKTQK